MFHLLTLQDTHEPQKELENTDLPVSNLARWFRHRVVRYAKNVPTQFLSDSLHWCPRDATWQPLAEQPQLCRRECGGGGDCFFKSVAHALKVTSEAVRGYAAQGVNLANVDELLQYYEQVYPVGSWHPARIQALLTPEARVRTLQQVIRTPGPSYQGDDTTLKLLAKHGVACLIWDARERSMYPHVFCNETCTRLVLLLHQPGHWQLLGWSPLEDVYQRVQMVFDPFGRLPPPVEQWLTAMQIDMSQDFGAWSAPSLLLERRPPPPAAADEPDAASRSSCDDLGTTTTAGQSLPRCPPSSVKCLE
jgi:hypothetical protein